MAWDIIVICLLLLGVVSGLFTMQRHHAYFKSFRFSDLFGGRLDAWLYLLNQASTAFCLFDAAARFLWLQEVAWTNSGSRWQAIWLSLHAFSAIVAIGWHWVTNRLLQRDDFCALCKRKL